MRTKVYMPYNTKPINLGRRLIPVEVATFIPSGMHATIIVDKARVLDDVVEKLIAQGVDPIRARMLVQRAAARQYRNRGNGMSGLSDSSLSYDQVMSQAQAASVSGDAIRRANAATAISDFLATHAPNLNNDPNDTGDLTNDQVTALDNASDSLTRGFVIPLSSPAAAAAKAFGKSIAQDISNAANKATSGGIASLIPWYVWAGAGVVAVGAAAKIFKG